MLHNFGASSTVPVDSLRNKAWVEANGICPSIMDYARFNYVAQPEDHITEKGIFPRIGAYDKWAIEWGYRVFPDLKNDTDEKDFLNKWVVSKLKGNKHLWFGSQGLSFDPRCQSEDLGDDAMTAGHYGIENLKRVESNLKSWVYRPGNNYGMFTRLQQGIVRQYTLYLMHAARNIGGVTWTEKTMDQPGLITGFTPKEKQKRALAFLDKELFTTPYWILNKQSFGLTGRGGVFQLGTIQGQVIDKIIDQGTLTNLLFYQDNYPEQAYKINELFEGLTQVIFKELKFKRSIDIYRKNLQNAYVNKLLILYNPSDKDLDKESFSGRSANNANTIIPEVVKSNIILLLHKINDAYPSYKDKDSRIHLNFLKDKLKEALAIKR